MNNHIVTNFQQRLVRYVRLRYEPEDAKEFITLAFSDDEEGKTEQQHELQEWLQYPPDKDRIKGNLNHFLKKLYAILQYFEGLPQDSERSKDIHNAPPEAQLCA